MPKAILITGATGKQGGSVIDSLLSHDADVEILAVTRDVTSGGAQKLAKKSPKVQLVQGNLDDSDAIFSNAKKATSLPIWGVFSVQTAIGTKHGGEERQGNAIVDTALKNNVKFFVYTSVDRGGDASIDNPTNVPHFTSKHNIEHHLIETSKGTDMNWVILRPTAFFDNFTPDFFGKIFTTAWKMVVKRKPLQLIAVTDIGYFGAQAFLNPDEYKGKCISLAGDELTFDDMAKIFKRQTGQDVPLTFEFVTRLLLWMLSDFSYMYKWFYDVGYGANIPALKKVNPHLKDFASWLETESAWKKK